MIPEAVRKALRARRMEDRVAAVEALARIDPAESTPVLLDTLRDRFHYVAALAAKVLAERRDPATAPRLIETFAWLAEEGKARDPGCSVRIELALALGHLGDLSAADVLFEGLRTVQIEPSGMSLIDTALHLRGNCALALSQLRPPGTLLALSLLLHGWIVREGVYEEVPVSDVVAKAIGYLGDPAGSVPLGLVLAAPPQAELAAACMEALVDLDPAAAVPLIAPFLKAPWAEARGEEYQDIAYLYSQAALTLARTRRPEVLPLLADCLDEAPPEALVPVAIALANLRTEGARAALIAAAESDRADVRAAVAPALALFPDDTARAALERLSRDPQPSVRQAAKQALNC